jgi:hypothetical protein
VCCEQALSWLVLAALDLDSRIPVADTRWSRARFLIVSVFHKKKVQMGIEVGMEMWLMHSDAVF